MCTLLARTSGNFLTSVRTRNAIHLIFTLSSVFLFMVHLKNLNVFFACSTLAGSRGSFVRFKEKRNKLSVQGTTASTKSDEGFEKVLSPLLMGKSVGDINKTNSTSPTSRQQRSMPNSRSFQKKESIEASMSREKEKTFIPFVNDDIIGVEEDSEVSFETETMTESLEKVSMMSSLTKSTVVKQKTIPTNNSKLKSMFRK